VPCTHDHMSRLDVELNISSCRLPNGAESQSSFISAKFTVRFLPTLALTGDSRVSRLEPYFGGTDDAAMDILFRALTCNRGLVDLNL
jgi:hypothetical protein